MRLQHLEQIAGALPTDDPARREAKAVIVTEIDRLHWRLWNGKAKDAQVSIERIRKVMHAFQGEPAGRTSSVPSPRKLWTALLALDGYLVGQADWTVNYAERHRAGLRVGTAITEGTANFLVNRRMNKPQQMRWLTAPLIWIEGRIKESNLASDAELARRTAAAGLACKY